MIKKFQNPSGKLTYEEALRQAGERVESQMKPSIQVKGVNNSDSRFKFKEKGIKRQFKKEAERERRMTYGSPTSEIVRIRTKKADPVKKMMGLEEDEFKTEPRVIGMSGTDPLMEFYVGGVALGKPLQLAGKGMLYALGRYARPTNYGQWASSKLISSEMDKALLSSNPQKLIPSLSQYISLTQQPVKQNESGLTSLKFFERPSKITEAERLGIPKGERNFRPKWHVANYPGYQLKGLMRGSQLERQLSKNGTISINQLNTYFNKASQIEREIANKVLTEKFAGQKTIDYNQFKKAVQDELIGSYNRVPQTKWADYGVEGLGYNLKTVGENELPGLPNQIILGQPVRYTSPGTKADPINLSTFTFESSRIPYSNTKHYGGNPIGHSRTYVLPEDPHTLHVMESQSDWGQSKNIVGLDDTDIMYKRIQRILGEKYPEDVQRFIKGDYTYGYNPNFFKELTTNPRLSGDKNGVFDRYKNLLNKKVPLQIKYLHDNYLQRQLQENLRYAAENGQTKMRYPTSETAVKIEGYTPLTKKDIPQFSFDDAPLGDTPYSEFISDLEYELKTNPNLSGKEVAKINSQIKRIQKIENRWKAGETTYLPEHETILDKYTEFPKLFQKLYKGQNVRIVTDAKGNTWYEVDVPKGYLNKEWQFKQGGKMNTTQFLKQIHKKGGKLLKAQGGTKFKTTGGAGYVPPTININTEKIKNKIRKNLYDNLYTHSYQSLSDAVLGALGIKSSAVDRIIENREELMDSNGNYIDFDDYEEPMDDAIWATYLSIPKNQRRKRSGELKISKYTPSVGKENNTVYYEFPVSESDKSSIIERGISLPIGKNKITNMDELSASISNIGDYTIGHGYDNKGEYVSVYDKWDLNPFKGAYRKKGLIGNIGNKLFGKKGDLSFGIGKPVNLYNRIYLDDYYKVPDPYRGGTYLPEVVVYPSQELYKRK